MIARKAILGVLFCLSFVFMVHAEPSIEWTQVYEPYNGEAVSRDVVQNSLQGYTLLGTSISGYLHNNDPLLVRTRPNGDLLRVRSYPATGGSDDYDIAFSMIEHDHSYFVCGTTETFSQDDDGSAFLMRLTLTGDYLWGQIWDWQFGTDARATHITALPNGNVLLLVQAYTGSFNTGFYLLEYAPDGTLVEERHYPEFDYVYDMTQLPDGRLFLIGYPQEDFYRFGMLLDTDRDIIWETTLSTFYPEAAFAHPDGQLFIAGKTFSGGYHRAYLAEYNDNGLWQRDMVYQTPGTSVVKTIGLRGDGDLLLAGSSSSQQLLIGADLDNDLAMSWSLTDSLGEYTDLARSWDGTLALTGSIESNNMFLTHVSSPVTTHMVCEDQYIDQDGGVLHCTLYFANHNDGAVNSTLWTQLVSLENEITTIASQPLTLDADGTLLLENHEVAIDAAIPGGVYRLRFVLGDSPDMPLGGHQVPFYKQIANENASTVASENSTVTAAPSDFALLPVYPNPFNAQATVTMTLPQSALVNVSVYDMLGREVVTLARNATLSAGTHQFALDGTALASGAYFVRLNASGHAPEIQRITLVK